MPIDWNTEASTQTPTIYQVPPGEYNAEFLSCEVSPWSEPEKPVLELKVRIPSHNAIISDNLRFYAGALPIAISKVESLGIDKSKLPEDDLEMVAKIIDTACRNQGYDIVCKTNNYNPEKPKTDIQMYIKTGTTRAPTDQTTEPVVEAF